MKTRIMYCIPLFFLCLSCVKTEVPPSQEEKIEKKKEEKKKAVSDKLKIIPIDRPIYAHERLELETNSDEPVTWRSSNKYIGDFERDNIFLPNQIGKTTITAKTKDEEARLRFEIVPKYDLFEEPIISFGTKKEVIKQKEKRKLQDEMTSFLIYEDPNPFIKRGVVYGFNHSGKFNVLVRFGVQEKNDLDRVIGYYHERYRISKKDNKAIVFVNQRETVQIRLTFDDKSGTTASYAPITG